MATRPVRWVLAAIAIAGVALTIASLAGTGAEWHVGGLRVSARGPVRPLIVASIAILLLLRTSVRGVQELARVEAAFGRRRTIVSAVVLASICGGVLTFALGNGSFVASAADSYGYVTQADAFAGAAPVDLEPQELAAAWPEAQRSLIPLGYVQRTDGAVVPSYPPGYPLLMAAFSLVWGHAAMFLVVPVAAAVLVCATFAVGARSIDVPTGLAAALLLAVSPVFLLHAAVPMSDVPAAALWACAIAVAIGNSANRALFAGLLSGTAVLVRPNLLPLAFPIALMLLHDRSARSTLRQFLAGMAPPAIALLYLNDLRYGSPFSLGYGPVAELFSPMYLAANLAHYPSWLQRTQTAFVFVGALALIPAVARGVVKNQWQVTTLRLLMLFAATGIGCYLFYRPFEQWGFLRFLLPALPIFLLLAVGTSAALGRQLTGPLASPFTLLVVLCVSVASWERVIVNGVLSNETSVRRFVDVSRYAATLPERAIFLTRLYSGSIRYYGHRPTIRWDVLDPDGLDRAIDASIAHGFQPYLVIEGTEDNLFRQQFAYERHGHLDWAPVAVYDGIETVRLYAAGDRRRTHTTPHGPAPSHPGHTPVSIPVSDTPLPRR